MRIRCIRCAIPQRIAGYRAQPKHKYRYLPFLGFPSRPHDAVVHLFTREQCQNIFSHLHITEDMLCAGHLDGRADACFVSATLIWIKRN